MSLAGVVLIVGGPARYLGQLTLFEPWWTALALLVPLLIITLGVGGRWIPLRVLRRLWVVVPVIAIVAHVTCFAAIRTETLQQLTLEPWILSLQPVAACYLILVSRPVVAIVYAVVSPFALVLSAFVFLHEVPFVVATTAPLYVGNVALVVLFLGVRSRLAQLSAVEAHARAEREREVRAEEAARVQQQLALVVHDEVLSTLTAAMQIPGVPPVELRREASNALSVLAGATALSSAEGVTTDEAAAELRAAVRLIAPDAEVTLRVLPGRIPGEVHSELRLALGEAARNSVRHAGPGARRWVEVELSESSARVVIRDDGTGFDLDSVPPERLGLRHSIVGRMQGLAGGASSIVSQPTGTTVELTWLR